MRVALCVPRKEDDGRRDEIWGFVRSWLISNVLVDHEDWNLYIGRSDTDPWSMAAARNWAARRAFEDNNEVVIFLDSDTIAHPTALEQAAILAATSDKLVVAGDMRMTMNKESSDEILRGGLWFPRPDGQHSKENCALNTCYGEPASGAVAIGRATFERIGGYCEPLVGWGYEDLVFMTCAFIWGGGVTWVQDSMLLHFWHPKSRLTEDAHRNYLVWRTLHEISQQENKRELATKYLTSLGHTWP